MHFYSLLIFSLYSMLFGRETHDPHLYSLISSYLKTLGVSHVSTMAVIMRSKQI